jgi:hypothetical protein
MAGFSATNLATVSQKTSQQPPKSLPNRFYQGIRLLDASGHFHGRLDRRGVCRGFTRVVCETVERLFSQDRGGMTSTKTPTTRKAANSSKGKVGTNPSARGLTEAAHPVGQLERDNRMIRTQRGSRPISHRRLHTCGLVVEGGV